MNKFSIVGVLDAGSPTRGTVLIDRDAGLFHVRPFKRRRTYTLPLSDVASIIVAKIVKAEVAEKRRAKKARMR